ncbi:MAG: CD1247 N-terminal domain-containing protein [Bacillota bacterium]
MREGTSLRERLLKMKELLAGAVWSEAEAQRLWEGLWEVCLSLVERLRELEAWQEEIGLYLEAIDEDLAEVEALLEHPEEEEGEEETHLDLCPRCRRPFSLS